MSGIPTIKWKGLICVFTENLLSVEITEDDK